jgi:hypothetical protein
MMLIAVRELAHDDNVALVWFLRYIWPSVRLFCCCKFFLQKNCLSNQRFATGIWATSVLRQKFFILDAHNRNLWIESNHAVTKSKRRSCSEHLRSTSEYLPLHVLTFEA